MKIGFWLFGKLFDDFEIDIAKSDVCFTDPFVADEGFCIEDDDVGSVDGVSVVG